MKVINFIAEDTWRKSQSANTPWSLGKYQNGSVFQKYQNLTSYKGFVVFVSESEMDYIDKQKDTNVQM